MRSPIPINSGHRCCVRTRGAYRIASMHPPSPLQHGRTNTNGEYILSSHKKTFPKKRTHNRPSTRHTKMWLRTTRHHETRRAFDTDENVRHLSKHPSVHITDKRPSPPLLHHSGKNVQPNRNDSSIYRRNTPSFSPRNETYQDPWLQGYVALGSPTTTLAAANFLSVPPLKNWRVLIIIFRRRG